MTGDSTEMMTKKQRQIVETAEDLFLRYGIKRVTVKEICREAGASKMTFYKYFSNKDELARFIWDIWIQEGCRRIDEIGAMDIPFPQKLQRMWDYKMEWMAKMTSESIADFLELNVHSEATMQCLMKFITDAQAEGDIRPEIRPEFFLVAVDKMREIANNEELAKLYPSYEEFAREIWDCLFYGVLTEAHSGRGK